MINEQQARQIAEQLSPLQRILLDILDGGARTRAELVQITNHPRTTIYDNLTQLTEFNLVRKFARKLNHRGRPHTVFKLVESS